MYIDQVIVVLWSSCINILQGTKVTRRSPESVDGDVSQSGRTLEEARKLVEQSFGNYVGSNVMLTAKEELARIQNEIQMLTSEITDEAIDKKSRKLLSPSGYKEIADLQEELRVFLFLTVLDFFLCCFRRLKTIIFDFSLFWVHSSQLFPS